MYMKPAANRSWKRMVSLLLVVLLLITACPLAVSAAELSAVTTEYVHLRSGPGTSYSSKDIVASGTKLTVTDTSNSNWYAVRMSDGTEGYIYAEYLELGSSSSGTSAASAVTTEYVHLRSGPGTSYASKGVLASGTKLTVTDTSNSEWYAVKTSGGSTGYVFSKYIKLGSSSGSTATATPSVGESKSATTTAAVNLRSGPGTSYSTKGVIASGTKVTVTDTSNSSWYAVTVASGKTGYIYSEYLKMTSSGSSSSSEAVSAQTTEYVHLRSGAGTSYASKGVIASGTKLTVTDRSNSKWYAVKLTNGTTGYIYSQYIQILSTATATPAATATPTPAPTATPTPSSGSTVKAVVTPSVGVNLRKGPGTSYSVIQVVKVNTEVTVLEATNAQWYKVQLSNGTTGYLYAEYLKITSGSISSAQPTATPTPTPAANGTVTAKTTAALNLRKGAGTSYGVIKVVAKDTTVTVVEATSSDWYKVKLSDGTTGYFASQYLKITSGDISSVQPEKSDEEESEDETSDNVTATGEYVRTTVGLNLRKGAGTSYDVLTVLSSGTVLSVLERRSDGWVYVQTSGGTKGYVSAEYVVDYDPNSSSASVSVSSVSLAQYKTHYLEVSASGSVTWSSSNTSVATVKANEYNQLFVYGAKTGEATISAKSANGSVLTSFKVTVTAPEAIRFAYTTPNIISAGESFDLVAVTDTQKSAVKFEITNVGTYETKTYTSESQGSNSVRIFEAAAKISAPGTYTVRAYSNSGSGYSSSYREFTILVVSSTSVTETTGESRRISDEMLYAVSKFEGYSAGVYADTLAGNIPTVGYGYVVSKNTAFYNDLTKTEAMAMLTDDINRSSYTSEVNKFISNNGLKMSQCQFDALVSFSYNIGASYWNSTSKSCYLRTVLLNTVVPPENLSSSNAYAGTVTASSLTVYSDHDASSKTLKTLSKGAAVSVIGYYRDAEMKHCWYQVSVSGTTGWVRAGDVSLNNTSGLTRDLNYVDAYTFGSNMLDWHVAGGKCYIGLYYRRLAEAKVFSYAAYDEAIPGSTNYKKNTYGYDVPTCF